MKLSSSSRAAVRYDAGPNMTPLVDVVMVILVFVMLTATFNVGRILPGPKLGLLPPLTPTPVQMPKTDVLELDVTTRGGGGGGYAVRVGDHAFAGAGDAGALLAHLRAKRMAFEAVGAPAADAQVVVRPQRGVAYRDVIAVYEAALRSGFVKVGFAPSR
jgi:biopolymer transport protein ExbD